MRLKSTHWFKKSYFDRETPTSVMQRPQLLLDRLWPVAYQISKSKNLNSNLSAVCKTQKTPLHISTQLYVKVERFTLNFLPCQERLNVFIVVVVNSVNFFDSGYSLTWSGSLKSVLLTTITDNNYNNNNTHHHSMCIKYISHTTNTSVFIHLFIAIFNLLLRSTDWGKVLSPQCFP